MTATQHIISYEHLLKPVSKSSNEEISFQEISGIVILLEHILKISWKNQNINFSDQNVDHDSLSPTEEGITLRCRGTDLRVPKHENVPSSLLFLPHPSPPSQFYFRNRQ